MGYSYMIFTDVKITLILVLFSYKLILQTEVLMPSPDAVAGKASHGKCAGLRQRAAGL